MTWIEFVAKFASLFDTLFCRLYTRDQILFNELSSWTINDEKMRDVVWENPRNSKSVKALECCWMWHTASPQNRKRGILGHQKPMTTWWCTMTATTTHSWIRLFTVKRGRMSTYTMENVLLQVGELLCICVCGSLECGKSTDKRWGIARSGLSYPLTRRRKGRRIES